MSRTLKALVTAAAALGLWAGAARGAGAAAGTEGDADPGDRAARRSG